MRKLFVLYILCISFSFNALSQFDFDLEVFAQGLNQPLDIAHNSSDRLFIVEKPGIIKMIMPDGQIAAEVFLDITDRVDNRRSEEGLLGLAFSPNYDTNGEFYVNYTNSLGLTVISRFTNLNGDPFKGDPDSEEKILQFSQPFSNHNGGDVAFGPDGYLYIASGDGGSSGDPGNNSQTGTSYLGKILRLDVEDQTTYAIPPDNPFIGNNGFLDEIWALGVRNPWRMSFDRETGDFWMGDVGQGNWEEIDFQPASSPGGENYGWRCYEGNQEYNTQGCDPPENYQFPIHVYSNNRLGNGCSVTGGYVYRGSEFPEMQGWYIYADYCSGNFWALRSSDSTNMKIGDFGSNQFVGFGEDVNGELYVAAIQSGTIYKFITQCELTITTDSEDETCPDANDGMAVVTVSDTNATVDILWSTGDTTASVSNLMPGTYTVNVTGGGCDLTDSVIVMASDLTESCLMDTLFVESFCEGDTIELRACMAPAGYTYEWSQFDAVIAETTMPVLKISEGGTYSVSFKGDCPLGSSREVEVEFIDLPDQMSIARSMDTLWADGMADSYRWYLNDTLLTVTDTSYVLIAGSGDYRVEGLNGDCVGPLSEMFSVINTTTTSVWENQNKVYPNPSSGILTVVNGSEEIADLLVFDHQGKIILKDNFIKEHVLDIQHMANGVYFIQVSTSKTSEVIKVLKTE